MFGVWQPEEFASVVDYETWEAQLLEDDDIARHVADATFVPVNIGFDGAFGFTVRVGTGDLLSARERQYVAVTSAEYLLVAQGPVALSGLERIEAVPAAEVVHIATTPGRWAVTMHLLDWAAEPGAQDEEGNPTEGALSDFVIELRPATGDGPFRQELETFVRPEQD